jgi:hypothetical protein
MSVEEEKSAALEAVGGAAREHLVAHGVLPMRALRDHLGRRYPDAFARWEDLWACVHEGLDEADSVAYVGRGEEGEGGSDPLMAWLPVCGVVNGQLLVDAEQAQRTLLALAGHLAAK